MSCLHGRSLQPGKPGSDLGKRKHMSRRPERRGLARHAVDRPRWPRPARWSCRRIGGSSEGRARRPCPSRSADSRPPRRRSPRPRLSNRTSTEGRQECRSASSVRNIRPPRTTMCWPPGATITRALGGGDRSAVFRGRSGAIELRVEPVGERGPERRIHVHHDKDRESGSAPAAARRTSTTAPGPPVDAPMATTSIGAGDCRASPRF